MLTRHKVLLLGLILLIASLSIAWWILTPRVVTYSPVHQEKDVVSSVSIEVLFNTILATQEFDQFIQIQPDLPFTVLVEKNKLIISPIDPLPEGATLTVKILPGIKSTLGLASGGLTTWSFSVKNAWLLYLLDGEKKTDLYLIDPAGLTTDKLMDIPESLIDYSVSPRGNAVVYTARSGQDTLIREYDLLDETQTDLFTCKQSVCSQPELSFDGKYLAFMSGTTSGEGREGGGRVWLLTLNNRKTVGEPIPVSGNDHPTRDPIWSSEGWLAIYDDADAAFLFYKPSSGKRTKLSNATGEPGSWNPAGNTYLVPEITYVDPKVNQGVEYYSRLVGYQPDPGQKSDLTQNNQVEDLIPVFSPSGIKVAFARRYLNQADWTPGRQVWIIDNDGSNARKMTNSPDFNHLGFAWSPDDRMLAYLRFNTASLNLQRELWIMDTQSGLTQKVLVNAYHLEWLP